MSLMFQPLRKYADFQGRARRSEYWLFSLFQFLLALVFWGIIIATVELTSTSPEAVRDSAPPSIAVMLVGTLCVLIYLGLVIPALAVTVRRLHDSNKSGWWLLISLLPFGNFVLLALCVLDGTPGRNRFGPDPKGRGIAETFA